LFILFVNEHKKFDISYPESGASEYEIYFTYMLEYNKNDIYFQKLKWTYVNNDTINLNLHDLYDLDILKDLDYCAICN